MEPCKWDEEIGKIKEFMSNTKGLKMTMFTISVAILIQVGAFLIMWGSLTETVKNHDKSINRILTKLDNVKIVGYAVAGERGEKGERGEAGKDAE